MGTEVKVFFLNHTNQLQIKNLTDCKLNFYNINPRLEI